MKKKIDISKHQGPIDFGKVKDDGVDGIVLRAGYGKNTVDQRFAEYITEAIKYGFHIGFYWFMYGSTDTDALQNAQKFHATIEKYRDYIDLGVWSDWEYDSDAKCASVLTKAKRTNFVKIFNDYMKSKGYVVGTYVNLDYIRTKFDMTIIDQYPIWLADYSGDADYKCIMRQYSNKGIVDGISGDVDMNEYYGELAAVDGENSDTAEEPIINVEVDTVKKTEVKALQTMLNAFGYKGKDGKALTVDGVRGTNTEFAWNNFAKARIKVTLSE